VLTYICIVFIAHQGVQLWLTST